MRRNVKLTATQHGVTRSIYEWAKILGLPAATLYRRKRLGWSDEMILNPRKYSSARFITVQGVSARVSTWAMAMNLPKSTIDSRLAHGLSPEEAVKPGYRYPRPRVYFEGKSIMDIAREHGLCYTTVYKRVRRGLSWEQVVAPRWGKHEQRINPPRNSLRTSETRPEMGRAESSLG